MHDSAGRARLEGYLRGARRDSSEWFRLSRRTLTLSHGLLWRLAAEEGGEDDGREATRRRKARARLERATGVKLEEDRAVGFPAGYLPDDLGLATETPQWGLRNDGAFGGGVAGADVNIQDVWERFDGSDTLVIAVIDAGYNFSHPDLQDTWYVNPGESGMTQPGDACWTGTPKDKASNGCDDDGNGLVDDWRGWDFVDEDNDPRDFHNHGTQTGGIIAARFDNATGIAGMLPRVKILPIRVLGTAGYGYTSDIAAGVRYAARMKAHAANFSIGIGAAGVDTMLRNAFAEARDSGVIIAAATGNNGIDLDASPRQPFSYDFPNVYGVAAHGANGALTGFSNYGATQADIAAPGVEIATTTLPPPLPLRVEDFEDFDPGKWSISPADSWKVQPDSMEGAKAFRWSSGVNTSATLLDTLDMRGKRGGLLTFRLHYAPSTGFMNDFLLLEYQRIPSQSWQYFAAINGKVEGQTLAYGLGATDDAQYRIRIRTCRYQSVSASGVVACNTFGNPPTTGRVVRIDELRFTYADETPAKQAAYESHGGGTSLAAPFFAGYAGLMRLAADRKGVPLTRELMLAGAAPVPALAGKVATGARLDVAKGLDFYLKGLPRVRVDDPLDTAWDSGSLVTYAFRAVDTAGAVLPDYAFTATTLPPGSLFEPEGDFSWSTGLGTGGTFRVRVAARSGDHVIRKMVTFAVGAVTALDGPRPDRGARLRIGGRTFALPASIPPGPRRLRVEFYGADGRTVQALEGRLDLPPGGGDVEYRVHGFPAPGLRAWLDGRELRRE